MDDLLSLIVSLRERIDKHSVELRKSEALTRSVLIDPLLRGLGWNTEDPSQVVPEFRIPSEQTRADYALFVSAGKADVIVEAKAFGASLMDAASQAMNYCNRNGYKCFAVTDGCEWTVYETFRPVPLEDKRIADFNLQKGASTAVCQAALSLWRQRFLDGMPPHVESTVGEVAETQTDPESATQGAPQLSDTQDGWIRLSKLHPESGTKPQELRFSTGRTVAANSWASLVVELTKWLCDEDRLPDERLPFRQLVAKRGSKTGSNGKLLASPHEAGDLWVATKFGGADHARNARDIIEHAGLNPDDFAVRLMN